MLKRKRFNFTNVAAITPDTLALEATVAEWNRLFTGNFVENLKLDLLRAEFEKDEVFRERSKIEQIAELHLNLTHFWSEPLGLDQGQEMK